MRFSSTATNRIPVTSQRFPQLMPEQETPTRGAA